jgi:hypothetical protein
MAAIVRATRRAESPNGEVNDAAPPTGGTGATELLDADADAEEPELAARGVVVVKVDDDAPRDEPDAAVTVALGDVTETVAAAPDGVAWPTGIGTTYVLLPIVTVAEPAVPKA